MPKAEDGFYDQFFYSFSPAKWVSRQGTAVPETLGDTPSDAKR